MTNSKKNCDNNDYDAETMHFCNTYSTLCGVVLMKKKFIHDFKNSCILMWPLHQQKLSKQYEVAQLFYGIS